MASDWKYAVFMATSAAAAGALAFVAALAAHDKWKNGRARKRGPVRFADDPSLRERTVTISAARETPTVRIGTDDSAPMPHRITISPEPGKEA